MLCGWGVKAGIVREWVAGDPVTNMGALEMCLEQGAIQNLIDTSLYFTHAITIVTGIGGFD